MQRCSSYINLVTLTEFSYIVFERIEHGLPQATVNRIIAQGDKYIIAIQEIVQAVGDGTTFAKDIVALCPEDGRSINISKIPESTHQIAETSYRATSQTCGQLRSIRKALSEVCASL